MHWYTNHHSCFMNILSLKRAPLVNGFDNVALFFKFSSKKSQPIFPKSLSLQEAFLRSPLSQTVITSSSLIHMQGACCSDELEKLPFSVTCLSLASSVRRPAWGSLHFCKPQLWTEVLIFSKPLSFAPAETLEIPQCASSFRVCQPPPSSAHAPPEIQMLYVWKASFSFLTCHLGPEQPSLVPRGRWRRSLRTLTGFAGFR